MKRHDKEIKARDTHIAQFQQEMHVVGLLFVEGDDVGEMLRRFSKVSRLPKSWLQGNWIVGKCLGGGGVGCQCSTFNQFKDCKPVKYHEGQKAL